VHANGTEEIVAFLNDPNADYVDSINTIQIVDPVNKILACINQNHFGTIDFFDITGNNSVVKFSVPTAQAFWGTRPTIDDSTCIRKFAGITATSHFLGPPFIAVSLQMQRKADSSGKLQFTAQNEQFTNDWDTDLGGTSPDLAMVSPLKGYALFLVNFALQSHKIRKVTGVQDQASGKITLTADPAALDGISPDPNKLGLWPTNQWRSLPSDVNHDSIGVVAFGFVE